MGKGKALGQVLGQLRTVWPTAIALLICVMGLFTWAAPASAASSDNTVIRLALGPKLTYSTRFWAALENQKNAFAEQGVKVEAIEYPNVDAAIAATLAGDADVFYSDFLLGVSAIKNGQDLTFVSPGSHFSRAAYFLKRASDSSVRSAKDLKGKQVAVSTSTFTVAHTISWLNSEGLSASLADGADVKIDQFQSSNHPASLLNGEIDVIHTWDRVLAYQWIYQYKFAFVPGTEGGVPVDKFLGNASNAVLSGWWAPTKFYAKHVELLARFDVASRRIVNWFQHDLTASDQRHVFERLAGTDFTLMQKNLSPAVFDSLTLQREKPYELHGFDYAATRNWVDLVAKLVPGNATSSEVALQQHMATYLLNSKP